MEWYKNCIVGCLKSFIPNSRDNLKQIIIKCSYLIVILAIIVSGICIGNRFITVRQEQKQTEKYRSKWETLENFDALRAENSDFEAWLKMADTDINNPVFKATDNSYYLNYNSKKKKSLKGELFFDYRCNTELDKNLIIYGNDNSDGSIFGNLKRLRNIAFFKEHNILELNLPDKKYTYRIYAVFLLDSSKDDNGYIYNIYRNKFINDTDFYNWIDEAKKLSVINTQLDVMPDDNILTLVTGCDDFEGARLVIMAAGSADYNKTYSGNATANHNVLYPDKWYTQRGIRKE